MVWRKQALRRESAYWQKIADLLRVLESFGSSVRMPRSHATPTLRIAPAGWELAHPGPVRRELSKRLAIAGRTSLRARPISYGWMRERPGRSTIGAGGSKRGGKKLEGDEGLVDYQALTHCVIVHHLHVSALVHLMPTHQDVVSVQARKASDEVTLLSLGRRSGNQAPCSEAIDWIGFIARMRTHARTANSNTS